MTNDKQPLLFSLMKHQVKTSNNNLRTSTRIVTIFYFFSFRLSRGVKAVIHAACGKCSLKTSIEEKKRKLPEKRIYVDNFYCHIHNDSGRELHPQLVFHLFTPWACKNNSYSWRQIIKCIVTRKLFTIWTQGGFLIF